MHLQAAHDSPTIAGIASSAVDLGTATISKSGLRTSRLGLGTVPLGNYPAACTHETALATVREAFRAGIRYFETAPLYGCGLAERRLGLALHDIVRAEIVLATKVGRLLKPTSHPNRADDAGAQIFCNLPPFDTVFDYSYDGVMRSLEDSLQRLGTHRVDVLHIHNIDPTLHDAEKTDLLFRSCMEGGYRALERLRADGTVGAIGVGNNSLNMLERFLAAGDFDCFMMAGHYNLLEHAGAADFLRSCVERGVAITLGSPFASGVLATGLSSAARFNYRAATGPVANRVAAIDRICVSHRTSLAAAALQFPLAHPAIAVVVAGCETPEQVRWNVQAFTQRVPEACWSELRAAGLLDLSAPLPV